MLDELGVKYGTDKSSVHHNYLDVYEHYLSPFKNKNISLIECGVGGYEYPDRGGESVRMWYNYFSNGKIIGIDIHEKHGIVNDRTEFWQGSQIDYGLLSSIIEREEDAEQRIFIDDASHSNPLTIETFKIVFPLLKKGDLYFIEDVHTSYWSEYFDGNREPGAKGTTMGFFAELVRFFTFLTHQLNDHVLEAEFKNDLSGKIKFIHFYKEMIVIKRL